MYAFVCDGGGTVKEKQTGECLGNIKSDFKYSVVILARSEKGTFLILQALK